MAARRDSKEFLQPTLELPCGRHNPFNLMELEMPPTYQIFRTVQLAVFRADASCRESPCVLGVERAIWAIIRQNHGS